ncbi:MAG: peptidylprolyl isomerase [Flavobacterium sp.]
MKLKHVLLGLSFFVSALTFAQQGKKEVLFTIDGKPYYTDEFIRVYNKNLDLVKDDSQKDLNNYLDLFIGYKLKVQKANKLGLQEGQNYKNELKSYRNQLSRNYVTDTKVTQELIDEAYARSLKEIRASHILFLVDENAAPADTLKAYNKAMDARKKLLAGADFGKLAGEVSEDPSAKENQGDLGYFSAFRMVYAFENGAYNTKKGEVSKPVRSRFGYHLIKVTDVRDNRGEVTVAHIMISKSKSEQKGEVVNKAKNTIDDIYQKLKQGEDFAELAKQFSEDKSSAENGGKINKFGSGELSSDEFEQVAFSLNKPGDFSAPFETQFGWHIVKLIEKHGVKPKADVQADFENRVRRDDRSRKITESQNDKLKKKYAVKKDAKVYAATAKLLTDKLYTQAWEMPKEGDFSQTIITINNDRKVPAQAFLDYVIARQRGELTVKPLSRLGDVLFEDFINTQLNEYYNDNLEGEYPEFAVVMEEYRDGLLLFELMEKEIWEKAKTDSTGLEQYFNAHRDAYMWKDRIEGDVYSTKNEAAAKSARKLLKKGKSAEDIKKELNKDGKVDIIEKSGTFELESDALPKQDKWKTGVTDVMKKGDYYYVINVKKVAQKGPKSLEEARGRVVNDYQQYLEGKWVSDLKGEFNVQVNRDVFENVKKQLNQK